MCVLVCVYKCARKVDWVDVERAVAVAKNVPAVNQEVVRRVNFVPTVVIILDRCWPRHLKGRRCQVDGGGCYAYIVSTRCKEKGSKGARYVVLGCMAIHFPSL